MWRMSYRTTPFTKGLSLAFVFAVVASSVALFPSRASALTCSLDPLPSAPLQRIYENKSVYQQVASETGVPWNLLAAIHYREYNNYVGNPSNGQGIYQLYSIYTTDSNYQKLANPNIRVTKQNFIEQTRYAAKFLQAKAENPYTATLAVTPRKLTSNETNIELIKNALFSYNGRASIYSNQAKSYGFDPAKHPYEGSPYVMNQFDCYREYMGIITYDGGSSLTGTDTRPGAFTVYAKLKGNTYWKNLQASSMKNASRVLSHTIKPFSDKSGDVAKVGFTLTRKPEAPVTLQYKVSSPSNAAMVNKSITINPNNWNKASANIIEVAGLNNPYLKGTYTYQIIPSTGPISSDTGFGQTGASNVPRVSLLQQDVTPNKNVYRLYSRSQQKHRYTSSSIEKQAMVAEGWRDEGVGFKYCAAGNIAVSDLMKSSTGERRLAVYNSRTYLDSIQKEGYSDQSYEFSASTYGKVPVYWKYDSANSRSLYTTNINEASSYPWTNKGVAFYSCDTSSQSVYRFFRKSTTSHFYTSSTAERNSLAKSSDFRYEGSSYYTCSTGSRPLYRLYRKSNNTHFWTASAVERDSLINNGFRYEGESFRLCDDATRNIYRLFRKSNNTHFWTASVSERDYLMKNGFRYEGIGYKAQ